MVHSIEMLLDPETDASVRRMWSELADAGLRALRSTHRPHVTASVAGRIAPAVDEQLRSVSLPFSCVLGAPMLFGRGPFTLVRLVIPSAELLAAQAEIHRLALPYLEPGPADNTLPGRWTPHVTLARRVDVTQLARALSNGRVGRDLAGSVVALRRWDGDERVEHAIG